ncbi:MAG: AMP-binding protein, partial [Gaiellaceae bacterium]
MGRRLIFGYNDIPRDFNVARHFLDANIGAGRADDVALVTDVPRAGVTTTTYGELVALSNRIGNVLRDAGVRAEERVVLALADGPQFVASWFAVLKLGAVVAEVYTFLQPKDYAYYLRYARAGVVIADATTAPKIRQVRGECPELRTVLVADELELAAGESSLTAA